MKRQDTSYSATERMYRLCNDKKYFTCGSQRQYERFFDLIKKGVHLEIIARILWLCSEEKFKYEDIYLDCYETLMVEE